MLYIFLGNDLIRKKTSGKSKKVEEKMEVRGFAQATCIIPGLYEPGLKKVAEKRQEAQRKIRKGKSWTQGERNVALIG